MRQTRVRFRREIAACMSDDSSRDRGTSHRSSHAAINGRDRRGNALPGVLTLESAHQAEAAVRAIATRGRRDPAIERGDHGGDALVGTQELGAIVQIAGHVLIRGILVAEGEECTSSGVDVVRKNISHAGPITRVFDLSDDAGEARPASTGACPGRISCPAQEPVGLESAARQIRLLDRYFHRFSAIAPLWAGEMSSPTGF